MNCVLLYTIKLLKWKRLKWNFKGRLSPLLFWLEFSAYNISFTMRTGFWLFHNVRRNAFWLCIYRKAKTRRTSLCWCICVAGFVIHLSWRLKLIIGSSPFKAIFTWYNKYISYTHVHSIIFVRHHLRCTCMVNGPRVPSWVRSPTNLMYCKYLTSKFTIRERRLRTQTVQAN